MWPRDLRDSGMTGFETVDRGFMVCVSGEELIEAGLSQRKSRILLILTCTIEKLVRERIGEEYAGLWVAWPSCRSACLRMPSP